MTHQLPVGQSFRLAAIPKLGQDFRWRKLANGWYSVVLSGHLIHIRQDRNVLIYKSHLGSNLNDLLSSYFRLCDPIDKIYCQISSQDEMLASLVEEYHPGVRLLRQDPWECMVAYICSAPNSVNGITIIVEKIAEAIGQPIELCGDERYTFPTPEEVLCAGLPRLQGLKLGLTRRAEGIFSAAERISECQLDLCKFAQPDVPYTDTIRQLQEGPGIGNKVADCLALFALDKLEAFPVDRHIGRILADWYDDCPPLPNSSKGGLTHKQYRDIANWARKRFGKYACYVNQLLFHKQRPRNNSRRGRKGKAK